MYYDPSSELSLRVCPSENNPKVPDHKMDLDFFNVLEAKKPRLITEERQEENHQHLLAMLLPCTVFLRL